jgi:hypothetical protein
LAYEKVEKASKAWWSMLVIPALGRKGQVELELETRLSDINRLPQTTIKLKMKIKTMAI